MLTLNQLLQTQEAHSHKGQLWKYRFSATCVAPENLEAACSAQEEKSVGIIIQYRIITSSCLSSNPRCLLGKMREKSLGFQLL